MTSIAREIALKKVHNYTHLLYLLYEFGVRIWGKRLVVVGQLPFQHPTFKHIRIQIGLLIVPTDRASVKGGWLTGT